MSFSSSPTFCLALHHLIFRSRFQSFWHRILFHLLLQEALYLPEIIYIFFRDKSDSSSVTLSSCRASYAMNIVFSIVRNIIVYHHVDIVNINTPCHNICSHKNIYLSRLEEIHNLIAFSLCEVRMHSSTVYVHLLQTSGNILHLCLFS